MQENNPQGKTTQEGQQENHMAAPALAKGLPQCRDNRDNGEKVDVFILSGAEDLVPIPRSEGGDERDVLDEQGNGY
ncbi:MAG: hypothetical protein D3922_16220, partial [Candidatus Electrothrix sp. AR1]|nr:hypothetical protein [Candidatus Electrothrix sp. AR1]